MFALPLRIFLVRVRSFALGDGARAALAESRADLVGGRRAEARVACPGDGCYFFRFERSPRCFFYQVFALDPTTGIDPEHRLLVLINRNECVCLDIGLVRFYWCWILQTLLMLLYDFLIRRCRFSSFGRCSSY